MGFSTFTRGALGLVACGVLGLSLAALACGKAAAQGFAPFDLPPQLSLGPQVNFDTQVDRLETPKADPLKANDIAVAPDGRIWIASDHGLLEQAGYGWDLRPVTPALTKELQEKYGDGPAYGEKPKVRVGVRRVDVDPKTGEVWIVDADGRLAVLEKDVWRLVGTQIRDFGVYDGRIWVIPVIDPATPRATDGAILTGTREKYEAFYAWNDQLGEPLSIDVAPDGVAWIATSSGLLVRSHDGKNSRPGVWTIQGTPDCVDRRTGSPAACANSGRRLTDVAVIDAESAWITGTDRDGAVTRLFTNGLRLGAGLTERRGFKALASDDRGHLTALSDAGAPVHLPLVLAMTAKAPEGFALVQNETGRPDRATMRLFGEGAPPVVLPVPAARAGAPIDHAAALNPSNDLTIAFSVMPADGGPGAGTAPQCLVSLASSQRETLSICLDAAQARMTVRVGDGERTVPVTLGGVLRDGKPVARRFVLQTELGEARLFTVDETWRPDATFPSIQVIDTATVKPLTSFTFKTIRTDTSSNLRLTFGGRSATADPFRGYLGPVRVWQRGDLDPGVVFRVHDAGRWATAQSPAPLDLIADAPLAGEGEARLLSPVDVSGFWTTDASRTYDQPQIGSETGSMAYSRGRLEVFRIRGSQPDPAAPYRTGGLDVFRDGEGGVVITRFIQTASNSFAGWRHPQTGRFARGVRPFELTVTPTGIRVSDPNVNEKGTTFERIGEPQSIGPTQELAHPAENFTGYDIHLVSPMQTSGGAGSRGNVFSRTRLDDTGAPVEAPRDRRIPWGVLYVLMDKAKATKSERILETTRELKEDLSASVGVSADMPEVFSFSLSGDFERSVESMVEEEAVLTVGELSHAVYALVLDPARVSLDPTFRSRVEEAAAAPEAARTARIDEVLDSYGTHYTNFVIFGCRARFERKLTAETISKRLEERFGAQTESSGTVSGVTISVEGEFARGSQAAFDKTVSATDTSITIESGTSSFDAEETTCGESTVRGNPIARDLRPLTDLLSPVFFDDPKIYRDLRNAMGLRAVERLRSLGGRVGVSDASVVPDLFVVTLESLSPANLGNDNAVAGNVSVTYTPSGARKPETVTLWPQSGDTVARPSIADGSAVPISKRVFLSVSPQSLDAQLTAELTGVSSREVLGKVTVTLDLAFARARGGFGNQVASISAGCQCVTACPDGYTDEEGACMKTCPADFDTVSGGTCFGSYPRTFYVAWEMDLCKQQNPSLGCRFEGFGIYPNCKAGFRSQPFGWCQPICSEFGLTGWGGSDITCSRPEASRTAQGRSPSNSCPAGATPGVDCARVGIAYTVQKVIYED
jgi:hypothetical protein